MNTLSLKFPVRLPRVWLLLVALLIPHLAFAGYFYNLPATATVGSGYSGTWAGTVGLTAGITAYFQVKAPSASTWTTTGSGVSTYYGGCYVSGGASFTETGTWSIRIYVPSSGSVVDARTVEVN